TLSGMVSGSVGVVTIGTLLSWFLLSTCSRGRSRACRTWPLNTAAAAVATPQASSEMMRTRRSSVRCSITVIRLSSSRGGEDTGAGSGAGGGAVGSGASVVMAAACRARRRGRRGRGLDDRLGGLLLLRRRRLGRRGGDDLVLDLVRGLAELADALAQRGAEVGQLAGPPDDQHDHQQDDEVGPVSGAEG